MQICIIYIYPFFLKYIYIPFYLLQTEQFLEYLTNESDKKANIIKHAIKK